MTTTVGALTGVGIWLSVSLVNPYSIGSLIPRLLLGVFVEWLVFITEVCLILAYTLTWKSWREGAAKRRHIRLGFALGLFSWITMAIIVSILGFMMDPGNWLSENTLLAGFGNPVYLPQLAFRTPLAAAMAASSRSSSSRSSSSVTMRSATRPHARWASGRCSSRPSWSRAATGTTAWFRPR